MNRNIILATMRITPTFGYPTLAALLLMLAACGGAGSGENGANPGVLEVPIAFIKRPIPADNQQLDLREPRFFSQGGDVYVRDNSSANANQVNITASVTQGMGDVKGLNASFDGKRLIFSLRLFDPNPNDDDTPSWNIYEYNFDTRALRQVIDGLAADDGDDLYPAYLPDNRIIFSSSRQRRASEILINEGRTPFSALDEDENSVAMVLHVMNDQGGDIRQVSFNQSHDLTPIVLSGAFSGQVLFSRWDNAGNNSELNLYKTNPDGSDMELFYGAHSHNTGTNNATIQYSNARERPDGNIMAITQPFSGSFGGGDIIVIDTDRFVDNQRPIWSLNGLNGTAERAATISNIRNDGSISVNGRYASAFPLLDGSNKILVSKSLCQIEINGLAQACIEPGISNSAAQELSPAYGIWLYNADNNTERVVVRAEQGMVMTDVLALQARPLPDIILDNNGALLNDTWKDANLGVVNIKSVYDFGNQQFDGCFRNQCTSATGIDTLADLGDPKKTTADQRPARFVRFVRAVALPDPDDPDLAPDAPDLAGNAFGTNRNLGMREIVGYAAIAPDGSLKVKVPADVPLSIEVLDSAARRIGPRHDNWFRVPPGGSIQCIGCHSHNASGNEVPFAHYRSDANAPSVNTGLPATLVFANTQIPGTMDAYWGNLGQTMAEVRFDRIGSTLPVASPEPELDIDVRFSDIWTDPNESTVDADINYLYANLDAAISAPASAECSPWSSKCRSVINYEQSIHPLWNLNRGANTCTGCHTTAAGTAIADGQLDLTDGISDQNQQTDRFKSYVELFLEDAGETLAGGMVVNIQIEIDVLDGDGNVIGTEFIDDPDAVVPPSMSANGARASYFIEKMTETELDAPRSLPTAVVDHSGFLNDDELRLIAEWLDLGGQNFNNPFDMAAPQN